MLWLACSLIAATAVSPMRQHGGRKMEKVLRSTMVHVHRLEIGRLRVDLLVLEKGESVLFGFYYYRHGSCFPYYAVAFS